MIVVAVAFLGPLFSGNPTALHGAPFEAPGGQAGVLGGDSLGRNVLDRVLDGGWRILLISAAATAFAIVLGAVSGVVAAYRGGIADTLIMRTVDVLLGIPSLVFVLMLLSVIGSHAWLVILGVGLTQAPQVARVLRAAAQDVSERDYVKAVAAWGVPPRTVIRRHVIPSLLTPLMVESALRLSFSIILVASLSFLGLGTQPPEPSWGSMLQEARTYMQASPWLAVFPGAAIMVVVLGFNFLGDGLRDVLDPRLRDA
jgi:peptide/nickel transport system permease protein